MRSPTSFSIPACLSLCATLLSAGAFASTQSAITVGSIGNSTQIPATLVKPDGEGPFPAVVIMHDCSGLAPGSSGSPARWADELVRQGYVVLMPDSFTPRGFAGGVCSIPGRQPSAVNGNVRAADAYGALAALRALRYVDGRHIGIMGGSHGGSATLSAMFVPADPADPLSMAKREGFAAGIALYPGCGWRYGAWLPSKPGPFGPMTEYAGTYQPVSPLLILVGEKDDWTPAEPCRRLTDASRAAGYPVEIKVYPGAYHAFDSDHPAHYDGMRNNGSSPTGRGATTGGDPGAWADAKKQVAAFFAQYLKPRP